MTALPQAWSVFLRADRFFVDDPQFGGVINDDPSVFFVKDNLIPSLDVELFADFGGENELTAGGELDDFHVFLFGKIILTSKIFLTYRIGGLGEHVKPICRII